MAVQGLFYSAQDAAPVILCGSDLDAQIAATMIATRRATAPIQIILFFIIYTLMLLFYFYNVMGMPVKNPEPCN